MAEPQTLRPSFHGTGGALFVIQFVNALLTILTVGIYNFWGRTRVRRYVWSQTAFELPLACRGESSSPVNWPGRFDRDRLPG